MISHFSKCLKLKILMSALFDNFTDKEREHSENSKQKSRFQSFIVNEKSRPRVDVFPE